MTPCRFVMKYTVWRMGSHDGLPSTLAAAGTAVALPSLWAVRHFRSPAVRAWKPPAPLGRRIGRLYARVVGDGADAVVLLHGLLATGDVFGAAYDRLALGRRVVVPDLLGFGRSLDASRSSFSIDDHLDALDQLADAAGLLDCRWSIGAHSMGSALALRWAARHRERVDQVVCWGAPLYASPEAATAEISGSVLTRLFVLDSHWAQRACEFNCRHRSAAGWVMAALQPSLPVAIARNASHHTWPAYQAALRDLVIETPWRRLLTDLDANATRVELVWGTRDRVGDRRHAHTFVDGFVNTTVTAVEGADHRLPMTHPEACIDQLRDPAAGP